MTPLSTKITALQSSHQLDWALNQLTDLRAVTRGVERALALARIDLAHAEATNRNLTTELTRAHSYIKRLETTLASLGYQP